MAIAYISHFSVPTREQVSSWTSFPECFPSPLSGRCHNCLPDGSTMAAVAFSAGGAALALFIKAYIFGGAFIIVGALCLYSSRRVQTLNDSGPLQRTIETLRRENRQLQQAGTTTASDLAEWNRRYTELQTSCNQMRQDIVAEQGRNRDLQAAITSARTDQNMQAGMQRLIQSNEALRNRNDEQQNTILQLISQRDSLTSASLGSRPFTHPSIMDLHSAQTPEPSTPQHETPRVNTPIQTEPETATENDALLQAKRDKLAELDQQIAECTSALENLEEAIGGTRQDYQQEIESATELCQELTSRRDALEIEISQLTSTRDALEIEVTELYDAQDNLIAERDNLENAIATLESRERMLAEQPQGNTPAPSFEAFQEGEAREGLLNDLDEQLALRQSELSVTQSEVDRLNGQLQSLNKSIEQKSGQDSELTNKLDELRIKLNTLGGLIVKKQDLDANVEKLEAQRKQLASDIQKKETQKTNLTLELSDLAMKASNFRNEVADLTQKVAEHKQILKSGFVYIEDEKKNKSDSEKNK